MPSPSPPGPASAPGPGGADAALPPDAAPGLPREPLGPASESAAHGRLSPAFLSCCPLSSNSFLCARRAAQKTLSGQCWPQLPAPEPVPLQTTLLAHSPVLPHFAARPSSRAPRAQQHLPRPAQVIERLSSPSAPNREGILRTGHTPKPAGLPKPFRPGRTLLLRGWECFQFVSRDCSPRPRLARPWPTGGSPFKGIALEPKWLRR